MLIDIDGNVDDIDGINVTLALALGSPDRVEIWNPDRSETGRVNGGTVGVEKLDEIVGSPEGDDVADPEGVLMDVRFEEIVGTPDEGGPPDEVLLDETVAGPDA